MKSLTTTGIVERPSGPMNTGGLLHGCCLSCNTDSRMSIPQIPATGYYRSEQPVDSAREIAVISYYLRMGQIKKQIRSGGWRRARQGRPEERDKEGVLKRQRQTRSRARESQCPAATVTLIRSET
ncbi:hypothetical protein J6590_047121 [Homalodisca vitripennis]|nr:hypothetical protein J6590_047121 [Homalodisca vitripennis]